MRRQLLGDARRSHFAASCCWDPSAAHIFAQDESGVDCSKTSTVAPAQRMTETAHG
jgi:hypothetical protein